MTGGRETVVQEEPELSQDLTGFPELSLQARTVYARAHSSANDAHWRASNGKGRFDLPAPEGTCYVATTKEVAVREWLGAEGARGYVTSSSRDDLRVTLLTDITGRAANLSTQDAAKFGITSELTSMTPYDVPQAWACFLRSSGFDAVQYTPRFTPGEPTAIGLFGPAGKGRIGAEVRVLDGDEALEGMGFTVLPIPSSSALTIK